MAGISAKQLKGNAQEVKFSQIDKKMKLKFNLNALYYLEQLYGDIDTALEEVKGGKIKSLIAITTAALSAGNNRLEPFTEEEVADIVQVEDLEPLAKSLEKLLGGLKGDDSTPSKAD